MNHQTTPRRCLSRIVRHVRGHGRSSWERTNLHVLNASMAVTDAVTFNALDTPTGVPRRDANALAGRCPSRTIVLSRTPQPATTKTKTKLNNMNQPTNSEALPRSASWIPFHDAPSISPCLVTDGINVEKARWKPRNKEWVFPHAKLRLAPTHWMPLPLPPNVQSPSTITDTKL
jgi:hypothetical protein